MTTRSLRDNQNLRQCCSVGRCSTPANLLCGMLLCMKNAWDHGCLELSERTEYILLYYAGIYTCYPGLLVLSEIYGTLLEHVRTRSAVSSIIRGIIRCITGTIRCRVESPLGLPITPSGNYYNGHLGAHIFLTQYSTFTT